MDDAVAQMMRDLGNERRDVLSAPAEAKVNRQQEEAILAKVEAARRTLVANVGTDARAQRLRAWNDESTFEPDEVSARLENRMSGQGHRERLNASLHQGQRYDSRREMQENRVGEERSMYMQERAVRGSGNYSARTPSAASGHFNAMPPPPSLNASTPRSLGRMGPRSTGSAQPSRASVRPRAPSPRAAGRSRFVKGQRVVSGPSDEASTILKDSIARPTTSAQLSRDNRPSRAPVTPIKIKLPHPIDTKTPIGVVGVATDADAKPQFDTKPPTPSSTEHPVVPNIVARAMAKMRANDAASRAKVGSGKDTKENVRPTEALDRDAAPRAKAGSSNVQLPLASDRDAAPIALGKPVPHARAVVVPAPLEPTRTPLIGTGMSAAAASGSTSSIDVVKPNVITNRTTSKSASITSDPPSTTQTEATPQPSSSTAGPDASASAPERGYLSVLVTGVAGEILATLRHTLDVAVRLTASFRFDQGTISVHELANAIERLARDLERGAHDLEGVRRSADGLLEECWNALF